MAEPSQQQGEIKESKKRKAQAPLRSRNEVVDEWLGEDGVAVGEDSFVDLEDFIAR